MPDTSYYRLYRFDRNGHIVSVKELNCRNDFDALEQAKRLARSEEQEPWSGTKLLARVKSGAPGAIPASRS